MNLIKDIVEVGGKLYNLQHPGNREYIKLQQKLYDNKTGQVHLELLLDYCFEHVVFPDQGSKITLDTISLDELEVWGDILPSFLRGKLATGKREIQENKSGPVPIKTGSK